MRNNGLAHLDFSNRKKEIIMSDLKEKVIEEIKKIYDPEIPVNIYELGLIYKIEVDDKNFKGGQAVGHVIFNRSQNPNYVNMYGGNPTKNISPIISVLSGKGQFSPYSDSTTRFFADYKDKDLAGKLGFGGIANVMPVYSGFVMIAFFAGLGLPGLSGFISEAFCFIGGFSVFKLLTVIGTLGILLNAVYFLRAYQRMFWGDLDERNKNLSDITSLELITIIPLTILIIALGVYPSPLIDMIQPAVQKIINIIQISL